MDLVKRHLARTALACGLRASSPPPLGPRHGFGCPLVRLALYAPRIHGLVQAWRALLEEDRPRAASELAAAFAAEQKSATFFQLTGRYGIDLLLRALDGTLTEEELAGITALPASQLRWDRQFALFARAVLAGRAGEAEAVAEALRAGAPYATGHHLGLRLASEAALADGWAIRSAGCGPARSTSTPPGCLRQPARAGP